MLTSFLALLLAGAPALPAPFDKVLLKDGRIIEGKLLESEHEGFIMLRLPGADIPIRSDLVDKTYVEDLEGYVPKNETERKNLEKGMVLFEGTWMSRTRREGLLKKRKDEESALIDQTRKEQDWRNRKKVETRHFVIESNCTQDVVDQAATLFEQYYDNFVDFWGIKRSAGEQKEKMKFFFYRSMENFHFVTNTGGGIGGYFSPLEKELHLPYNQQEPQEAWDVLLHEGNHMLTHLISPGFRYPNWLNEGMAEYYGTARPDEKGKFQLGGLQYKRIVSLRNDEAKKDEIGLRDLLMMPNFGARGYAVAWSFVHFLMESPKYSKNFKLFFKNLSENMDVKSDVQPVSRGGENWKIPRQDTVIAALEKALGARLSDLEKEWKEYQRQAYGELTPEAYYHAARVTLFTEGDMDENAAMAMEFYQRAVDMGIENAGCYRDYAEMLRKGGVDEGRGRMAIVQPPDPVKAWEMIQRAIELDPVNPYNYTEAAGILIMDGAAQDLDRASAMVDTALALAPLSYGVRGLTDQLVSLIEPAKEKRRQREEAERLMREQDRRQWTVMPFYYQNETPPDRIENLSTEQLRELIRKGEVDGQDSVFQTYRMADPETGELLEGTNRWDKEWVPLKDVPEFAEDLQAAGNKQEQPAG